MDVDDLIASMNNRVHVGREGYDLQALQAHLSKTLGHPPAYASNAQPLSFPSSSSTSTYQPVTGVHYVPPPPVSSLNSIASSSSTPYDDAEKAKRPVCTPLHSYRGFKVQKTDEEHQEEQEDFDMETDGQENAFINTVPPSNDAFCAPFLPSTHDHFSYHHPTRLPSPPDEADFSAFGNDAFAPLRDQPYSSDNDNDSAMDGSDGGGSGVNAFSLSNNNKKDAWAAFKRKSNFGGSTGGSGEWGGFGNRGIASTGGSPTFGATEGGFVGSFGSNSNGFGSSGHAFGFTSANSQPNLNTHFGFGQGQGQSQGHGEKAGLPTPPEDKGSPVGSVASASGGNGLGWSGRLRDTKARSARTRV